MSVLHIEFPPPKVHGTIKGTSFIVSATKHHTLVRLQLDPAKRRSQVYIFKQCLEALGSPQKGPSGSGPIIFQRVGKTVSASFLHDTTAKVVRPNIRLWTASPGMLRALLAIAHGLSDLVAPQDITDFAHLLWLLREKEGDVLWNWLGVPSPQGTLGQVSANGLTPVFSGAKMVLVNGEPIVRKGALRGLSISD